MSPLWNSALARLWPRPRACLGVALGRNSVTAAHLVGTNPPGAAVGWTGRHELSFRLFAGTPPVDAVPQLARVFEECCAVARKNFLPVQIALPDPATSIQVFELDAIPKSHAERTRLAHWRIEKELGLHDVACVSQYLGQEDGRHLLLAIGVNRTWLAAVLAACRLAGIAPRIVDAAICHTVDRFHDTLARGAGDAALLVVEPDSWTLALFDARTRLRFVRSRWRDEYSGAARADEHQSIANDVERTVLAYVHGKPGREVGSVYITGTSTDLGQISAKLDERMHRPTVLLAVDYGLRLEQTTDADRAPLSPAITAAVLR